MILMTLSNHEGHLVLTTGNKSEIATGYSTLYGDSAGGFAPIKDVLKTLVWQLARWRNEQAELAGHLEACESCRAALEGMAAESRWWAEARELAGEAGVDRLRERVGLPLSTYFSGPKITWLLDHVDGARRRAEAGPRPRRSQPGRSLQR